MERLLSHPPNAWSSTQLAKTAYEEFGETEELMESSLRSLRSWIAQSPHLHSIRQDDHILKQFLRGCKFSLERTKEKLDNFHAVKGSLPEWFDNWDPKAPGVQDLLSSGAYLPLPGYDRKGRFVILCSYGKINPNKVRTEDLFKASSMVKLGHGGQRTILHSRICYGQ